MHDHISIAHNSKRSTGMKLILVLFESYGVEDFFSFRKPLLIYLFSMLFIILSNWGDFDSELIYALDQLCPTQMAHWAEIHVTISTRAAHFMTY